ncbi:MAG: FecR domain-containing protein [Opitutales bacterium]
MNRLQELLIGHEEGSLDAAEIQELKSLLSRAKSRAEAAEYFHLGTLIDASFRETHEEQRIRKKSQCSRPRPGVPIPFPVIFKIAAIFVVLLALAGAYWWTQNDVNEVYGRPVATIEQIYNPDGTSSIVPVSGESRVALEGQTLAVGDRISTDSKTSLQFHYIGEDTTIRIAENSELFISERDGAKVLRLDRGFLKAKVAKQVEGAPLMVETAHGIVRVLGTRFSVSAEENTQVAVGEGTVSFEASDTEESVLLNRRQVVDSDSAQLEVQNFEKRIINPEDDFGYARSRALRVDPLKGSAPFLTFDLGDEALVQYSCKMRFYFEYKVHEKYGEGIVRLFLLPDGATPETSKTLPRHELASVEGKFTAEHPIDFEFPPTALRPGINHFLVAMDPGGNDFFLSSRRSDNPPELHFAVKSDL